MAGNDLVPLRSQMIRKEDGSTGSFTALDSLPISSELGAQEERNVVSAILTVGALVVVLDPEAG
jgi:hypothetical protein